MKKISYTDTLGTHTVILTQTEVFSTTPNSSDPDFICGNQEINAYGYLSSMENAKPSLSWRMHDFVHDCEASASCEFAGVSPQVTDLDGNGVSEVWLVYYIGCRGDVSPIGMKILMYENGKKYAMRGETFVLLTVWILAEDIRQMRLLPHLRLSSVNTRINFGRSGRISSLLFCFLSKCKKTMFTVSPQHGLFV